MLESRWLICRICLKSENKKLYNIFEPISAEEIADLGTTLQDKIELCGDIKVNKDDKGNAFEVALVEFLFIYSYINKTVYPIESVIVVCYYCGPLINFVIFVNSLKIN